MTKNKIITCLTLVLAGCLSGCSGIPSGVLSGSAEGKLFTKEETVCLKSRDRKKPWNLKWATTDYGFNLSQLFVTVHEKMERFEPDYTAAIYVSVGSRFKLLKRLESWDEKTFLGSYFTKPEIIRIHDKRADDWLTLVCLTQINYGTANYRTEHIFTPTPELGLEEIEFVPAVDSFQEHLDKDEGIWKSEFNTFTDEKLSFVFSIYKPGDANCCPTGGRVSGTYKLERKVAGGFRISMDSFKREPTE